MLCVGLRWKTFAQKQSNQLLVSFSLGFLQISRTRQLEERQTSASRLLDVEPRICGLVHERLHVHLGKVFFSAVVQHRCASEKKACHVQRQPPADHSFEINARGGFLQGFQGCFPLQSNLWTGFSLLLSLLREWPSSYGG